MGGSLAAGGEAGKKGKLMDDKDVLTPMNAHDKQWLRQAAFRVTRLYPGPVGELLSKEILVWEEFGYRLGGGQLIMRLVKEIMGTKLPGEETLPQPTWADISGNVE